MKKEIPLSVPVILNKANKNETAKNKQEELQKHDEAIIVHQCSNCE